MSDFQEHYSDRPREELRCRFCGWEVPAGHKGWSSLWRHVQFKHTKAEREGDGGQETDHPREE